MFNTACIFILACAAYLSDAANSKRGLCFAQSDGTDIAEAENAQTSWVYNWGTTPPDYLENTGMTYIPMQWGASGASDFQSAVLAQGANTILVCFVHSGISFSIMRSGFQRARSWESV